MSKHCVVMVTCPDRATGERIAETLVEEKLAACANVIHGVTSIYRWQGETRRDAEVLLIIKTRRAHVSLLEARTREMHPYDVPEIIACDITAGSAAYLKWIEETTG